MSDLKEILCRVRATKQEKKKIHDLVREALAQSGSYQKVVDEFNQLKTKKKQLENAVRSEYQSEIEKIERMNLDIKTDTQLMSDLALNKFMKGETVEITDENDVRYEPVFKVTFKKTG